MGLHVNSVWWHTLTFTIAVLLTSGIWLTAYFAGVKPSKGTTNNYYNYGPSSNTTQSTLPPPPNTQSQCGPLPAAAQCGNTCEFMICESIPAGLVFDPQYPIFNSTTNCWMRLMQEAQNEILIGSYYWSLTVAQTGDNYTTDPTGTSKDGAQIYQAIQDTAKRGVNFRIAQTYQDGGYPETEYLVANSNGNIKVRSLDFTQWYPGGILHTKSWSVDRKHFYVGSANFDWRSLTQVKELGLAAFNCPCLAQDLSNLLEIYWAMGAPGATQFPPSWPASLSTSANNQNPTTVPQPGGDAAVYFSASPPGFQACGREGDIQAMIKNLDEAQDTISMAVMDYAPCTLYMRGADNNYWYPALDDAIRRAAFDRGVKVQFLLSRWTHTYKEFYSYMHSLNDLTSGFQCVYKNNKCVKRGSIEVRLITVPGMQYSTIPYARVYHNKYFVTEKAVYIGTSNWTGDYWEYTAGIGVVVRSDDTTQSSHLVQQIQQLFNRDWNSSYVTPISAFDNCGNWLNSTTPAKC